MAVFGKVSTLCITFLFITAICGNGVASKNFKQITEISTDLFQSSICYQGLKEDIPTDRMKQLKSILASCQQQRNKLISCMKVPECVNRYQKMIKIGSKEMNLNLDQSIRLTLQEIKKLTQDYKDLNR